MNTPLQSALEAARAAVQFDQAGDKQKACAYYTEAATLLQRYGNSPAGALDKVHLDVKVKEYIERAEALADLQPLVKTTGVVPRWARQEAHANKILKEAQSDHQDHKIKDALKKYQKAAQVFSDASKQADPEGQARIHEQWTVCCERARQLGGKMTTTFATSGPNLGDFIPAPASMAPATSNDTAASEVPPDANPPTEETGTDLDSLQRRLAALRK